MDPNGGVTRGAPAPTPLHLAVRHTEATAALIAGLRCMPVRHQTFNLMLRERLGLRFAIDTGATQPDFACSQSVSAGGASLTLTNAAGCCPIHLAAGCKPDKQTRVLPSADADDTDHRAANEGLSTPSTSDSTTASTLFSGTTLSASPSALSGDVVALMLQHGCPGTVRDGNKQTILHHAVRSGNNDAALVLLQWAVSPRAYLGMHTDVERSRFPYARPSTETKP